ncbi:TIGR02530 family flagellar biosynthesis protein [Niallia sp. Krafla_26]|uniref:TIGR02530 family flagellar biosynthesis protein n=1 Tax=Niallia sp. Krafla_26 TaxID=3064703 RepID=UPI003D17A12F
MTNKIYRPYKHPFIHNEGQKPLKGLQNGQKNFAHELQTAFTSHENQLTLSKHAKQRLEQRGIVINEEKWSQIGQKVNEAKNMGVNDSLVILDDAALIISAKNQTVITAMDRNEATAHIFTNINGTILMD